MLEERREHSEDETAKKTQSEIAGVSEKQAESEVGSAPEKQTEKETGSVSEKQTEKETDHKAQEKIADKVYSKLKDKLADKPDDRAVVKISDQADSRIEEKRETKVTDKSAGKSERTEYKTEYKKKKRYTKRRQQVIRQLFFMGVAAVVIIIGGVTWAVKFHNASGETEAKAQTAQTKKKADVAKKSVENGVQANSEAVEDQTEDKDAADTAKKTETAEERIARVKQEATTAGYPEKVIELLDKNPETVQFVEDYAKKKDQAPAATVEAENGYSGMFPEILQWDERWGYHPYGTSIIAVSGCGPTCISMLVVGLTGDKTVTPAVVADYATQNHYVDNNNDTTWAFMTSGVEHWGLKCRESNGNESEVAKELQAGHPVICSMRPGDFTDIGHFIILTSYDNGNVTICDPFSLENSKKSWSYSQISPQIKAVWVYSK